MGLGWMVGGERRRGIRVDGGFLVIFLFPLPGGGTVKLIITDALEATFPEVHYSDFYRDIFPVGSFEQKGVYEDGKYNGIAVSIVPGAKQTRRITVTDDLEAIDKMAASDEFCLMSPISYAGKSRKSENARFLYAMAIDLDGVETIEQWRFLMEQIERGHEMLSFVWGLPRPTYIVASGTGVHLYYVFEKPVPLFRNIVEQLEKLKRRITWQAWTQGASSLHDKVQYESLFQGFRVVGTITKTGSRCRAFKSGEKITVEYLNQFVPEDYRTKDFTYKSDLSLTQAKKKYPEWYERRIVQGLPKGSWTASPAVYEWWIRTLSTGAEQGHRYWCIMALAAYAKKCGISRDNLEADAYGLIPLLNSKGDAFTEDDVLAALEAYNDSYVTYPIDAISLRTGIPIQKNKRNGRKQALHLRLARASRDILCEERGKEVWWEGAGRPKGSTKAKAIVEQYQAEHPGATKSEIKAATGLSYPTIRKYYKTHEGGGSSGY